MFPVGFVHPALVLLVAALLTLSNCGKASKITGHENALTHEQALTLARRASEGFNESGVLARTRALLFPIASSKSLAAKGASRCAARGVQTDGDNAYTYEIQAWDEAGNLLEWDTGAYDAIARLNVVWDFRWDWAESTWSSRGHAKGAFDVTGLRPSSENMTWNGFAADSSDFRWQWEGAEYIGHGIWAEGFENLVWRKDWTAPYPLGGRITLVMDESWTMRNGAETNSESFRENVAVTFNGTRYAEMIVDGRYHFRLDLETGDVEDMPA